MSSGVVSGHSPSPSSVKVPGRRREGGKLVHVCLYYGQEEELTARQIKGYWEQISGREAGSGYVFCCLVIVCVGVEERKGKGRPQELIKGAGRWWAWIRRARDD